MTRRNFLSKIKPYLLFFGRFSDQRSAFIHWKGKWMIYLNFGKLGLLCKFGSNKVALDVVSKVCGVWTSFLNTFSTLYFTKTQCYKIPIQLDFQQQKFWRNICLRFCFLYERGPRCKKNFYLFLNLKNILKFARKNW